MGGLFDGFCAEGVGSHSTLTLTHRTAKNYISPISMTLERSHGLGSKMNMGKRKYYNGGISCKGHRRWNECFGRALLCHSHHFGGC